MFKRKKTFQTALVASMVAVSLGITACSSSDDDDNPLAIVDDVEDSVDDVVDGGEDAIDDVVDGGEDAIDDVVDGGEDAIDDVVDGGEDVVDGGEDVVDGGVVDAGEAPSGSYTFTFLNTSESQPMTPPVVILHNAPGSDNAIQFFEVGAPAIEQVIDIAEDGVFMPLLEVAQGQIGAGTVGDAGAAPPEVGGPLTPGATSSITLTPTSPDQVVTIVTMVVCTNDGFTGVDSRPLASEQFMAPIYDAGSETNVLTLDYWVAPCGTETNITDDENGLITAHPGQSGSENPIFDFEAGTELLQVTVSFNP